MAMVRRLAAILAADVVGYSRMMSADETGTHDRIRSLFKDFVEPTIDRHHGRVVKFLGDGVLAEFASIVEAVECAVAIQLGVARLQNPIHSEQRIFFRIGVNLGDIIIEEEDIYGDGVNIAARLEGLAEPGSVCIAQNVYNEIKSKVDFGFEHLGEHTVKNIPEPLSVYRHSPKVRSPMGAAPSIKTPTANTRTTVLLLSAILVVTVISLIAWLRPWMPDASQQTVPAPVVEEPSMAVLPFDNLSDDPNEAYFSTGVTEDVISALGRFSNLTIMSLGAVAPYARDDATPADLRSAFGVRYVVSGSVRRVGERVRVNVQLIDAVRGGVIWSERYDESSSDIFTLQDQITHQVVSTLAVRVVGAEMERARIDATESIAAYDLVLRGRERLRRRSANSNIEARRDFERAITLDPDYAPAYVGLAETNKNDFLFGWTEWPQKALQKVRELAERARDLNQNNAQAYSLLGSAHGFLDRPDLAEAAFSRALELNPNDSRVHADLGVFMTWSGRPRDAIEPLETARRFDPTIDPGWADLGTAYFLASRSGVAITVLEDGLSQHPERTYAHIVLTAAYAENGRLDDAKRSADRVRRLHPFFEIEAFASLPPFKNPEDKERVRSALLKAGLS